MLHLPPGPQTLKPLVACLGLIGVLFCSTPRIALGQAALAGVAVNEQDSLALLTLYNTTNGPSWNDGTWLAGPVSTWAGVVLTNNRVTSILLGAKGLTGSIPAALSSLNELTTLSLHTNQLSGPIPTELGNLEALKTLNLGANQLTGGIPAELGNLEALATLNLGGNQLTGRIPTALGSLEALATLSLGGNQLTGGIPAELGNLEALTTLNLGGNQLTGGIPAELGNLEALATLNLGGNQLTGSIPPALGDLSALAVLSLGGNQLTGAIPPELGNVSDLTELALNGNQLTGTIPPALGNLAGLTKLLLNTNNLTGEIPRELRDLSQLTVLSLHTNQLTGELPVGLSNLRVLSEFNLGRNNFSGALPEWVLNMDALTVLNLGGNQLTGEIPSGLRRLQQLTDLTLHTNQFTGEIPPELGEMSQLTVLNLSGNDLSGSIPSTLGDLTKLTTLLLDGNQLTGTMPARLGDLTQLTNLLLNGNQLTGSIPTRLGNLTQLTSLVLGGNELTGTIPAQLGNLDQLTVLNLSGNALTGEIPAGLGNLTQLTSLLLNGNALTGSIPSAFSTLRQLRVLDLSGNALTGEIPAELGTLPQLTTLVLSGNQLSGAVPAALGDLGTLVLFNLGGNQLTGSIPPALLNLTGLTVFSLSDNQLTGEIPAGLDALSQLRVLNLGGNALTGTVPPGITSLTGLTALSLNNNALTGPIPSALDNLTALVELFLNGNQFTGEIPEALGNLNRLTVLNLSNNQLTGEVPDELDNLRALTELSLWGNQLTGLTQVELDNLTSLKTLWLFNNQLIDLPDLSSLTQLNDVQVHNNHLTFEDLEPNVGVAPTFTYAPQATIGTARTEEVGEGDDLAMSFTVGGDFNAYQWFKGDTPISGATSATYTLAAVTKDDAGVYVLEITNTQVPDLALESAPIQVMVGENPAPTAAFSATPVTGTAPLEVSFDASASVDNDGTIESYTWDFGDNTTDALTQPTTSHIYTQAGHYTALLTVTDNDGNSNEASQDITVNPGQVAYAINRTFGNATAQTNYRLLAVPGATSVPLAGTLTGQSPDDWRAFWDSGEQVTYPDYLVEYDGSTTFSFGPGRGFWVLSREAWQPSATAPPVALSDEGLFAVEVHAGWNIISNPFDVDIAWDDVLAVNGISLGDAPLYRWTGQYGTTSQFASARTQGEAFYFNNDLGLEVLKLPYPGLASIPEAAKRPAPAQVLTLAAYRDGLAASTVRAGMARAAKTGRDAYDEAAPPGHFEAVSLRLVNPEIPGPRSALAADFRPAQADGYVFDVVLHAPRDTMITVAADGLADFASGEHLYLVDTRLGQEHDLRAHSAFTLAASPAGHRYRLIIGSAAFAGAAREALLPRAITLQPNYPNPFNPETVIAYTLPASVDGQPVRLAVYNVLGQRVRLLVDAPQRAGFHRVRWQGTDDAGAQVASGLYFYRLQVGTFNQTRQMILLK